MPAAVPAAPTPPPPANEGATGPGQPVSDKDFNTCRKLPSGQRVVKLNLKPETELVDLIGWISAITCKQFILPGSITSGTKKVTIFAPGLMSREEAYRVFLNALDSIGLTVEPMGKFMKIIETSKAKSASIPLYGFDGLPWSAPPKKQRTDR